MSNSEFKKYFNSNMVRLKDIGKICMRFSAKDFNSNMVRLKGWYAWIPRQVLWLFQFQYGAIKRIGLYLGYVVKILFQFQYGAIKSYDLEVETMVSSVFQFQYGAIKRGAANPT